MEKESQQPTREQEQDSHKEEESKRSMHDILSQRKKNLKRNIHFDRNGLPS